MQDSRLRLEQLYTCRVRPVEERRLAHVADEPGSPVERPQSQGDAFPSRMFKNSMNTLEQVRAWKEQFPAVGGVTEDSAGCNWLRPNVQSSQLRTRAFYVVQNHFATSHHYDLRLHLDGTMFSWAIPRGFDPPYDGPRLGVETFPHGKSYALYEGLATHGSSHAGIWDVGEYEIDSYERLGDLDNEETVPTQDDDETAPAHDVEQEAKLRDALRYCHFANDNQPTRGNPSRSFKILLKGTRFQNLRLEFSRRITDVKHVKPKDTRLPTTNRQWTIVILGPKKSIAAAAATATTSILTGRTMDEIDRQSRAKLLSSPNMVEENERKWAVETGKSLAKTRKVKKEEEALDCEEASLMLQVGENKVASA